MTPPAPETNRQNPLPLIAVATAVAGLVASRSFLGKVAMAAAAGAAAYRWANTHKPPTPPSVAKDDTRLAQDHFTPAEELLLEPESRAHEPVAIEPDFPPAPEYTPVPPPDFVVNDFADEKEWAEPESDAEIFKAAPADSPEAACEIAATFEEEVSPVFEGDPILQSAPPAMTEVVMEEPAPLVELPATAQDPLTPALEQPVARETAQSALFEQPQWVLSMEPLPPLAETQAAAINASLFDSDVFTRRTELAPSNNAVDILAEGPKSIDLTVPEPKSALEPTLEPDPEPTTSDAPLSSAHMAELLSSLLNEAPEFTKPSAQAPVELTKSDAGEVMDSGLKVEAVQELFSSVTLPPPAKVPVSVADLFARLAPRTEVEPAAESQPGETLQPVTTSASGPVRNKNRPMITVPSASNPLRKNWLTWWK